MDSSVSCFNSVIPNRGYTLNFKCREDCLPYGVTASKGDEQSAYDIEYCVTKAGYPEVVLLSYGSQSEVNAEPIKEFHWDSEKSVLSEVIYDENGKQSVRHYVYIGSGKNIFENMQENGVKVMEFVMSLLEFSKRDWKRVRSESAEKYIHNKRVLRLNLDLLFLIVTICFSFLIALVNVGVFGTIWIIISIAWMIWRIVLES